MPHTQTMQLEWLASCMSYILPGLTTRDSAVTHQSAL